MGKNIICRTASMSIPRFFMKKKKVLTQRNLALIQLFGWFTVRIYNLSLSFCQKKKQIQVHYQIKKCILLTFIIYNNVLCRKALVIISFLSKLLYIYRGQQLSAGPIFKFLLQNSQFLHSTIVDHWGLKNPV